MSLPAVEARYTGDICPLQKLETWNQCLGSGAGLYSDSNGPADLDPDPGRPKMSPKKEKKEEFHV